MVLRPSEIVGPRAGGLGRRGLRKPKDVAHEGIDVREVERPVEAAFVSRWGERLAVFMTRLPQGEAP